MSLKHSPCGSSGINGDVDIFRQSVYLILMLSNRSRRPPHGATKRRHRRPRRLASRASLPIHPSRLTESRTMALPLFRVMSVLFHLSFSLIFLAAIRRAPAQVLDMKMSPFMTHCRKRCACILTSIFSSAKGYFPISRAVLFSDISSLPICLVPSHKCVELMSRTSASVLYHCRLKRL